MTSSVVLALSLLLSKTQGDDRARYDLDIHVRTPLELPSSRFSNSVDREVCGTTISTSTLRKTKEGLLRDVVGILQSTSPSETTPSHSIQSPTIRISKCQPQKTLVVVKINEKVQISTDDSILYQFRSQSPSNGRKLAVLPPNLMAAFLSYEEPEIVRVQDDIHPWIRFFIVADNRLTAISDDEGLIRFNRVPAGQYTLRLWHEVFGLRLWPNLVTINQSQHLNINWTEQDLVNPSGLN